MRQKINHFLAFFFAFAMILPVSAQVRPKMKIPFLPEKPLLGQKSKVKKVDVSKVYPALKVIAPTISENPLFSKERTIIKPTPKFNGNLFKVNAEQALWANVASEQLLGLYAFHPVPNIQFEELASYEQGVFNGGSGLVDNLWHGVYMDLSYVGWGIIFVYHYAFDTESWELALEPVPQEDYSVIATETANDPKTGEVFGQFYSADLSSLEWGVIDYTTMTRTSIGTCERNYVALGVTNDGRAYGVAMDGNLYQIDRTTGKETLVGSTGIEVTTASNQYYTQSGEIDPLTNEFYWASKDKNGTSVLYTVDLNDAHTTKVGDYGDATIAALTISKPQAANGAPAKIEDLAVKFEGPSTTGNVTFTAPVKKFDGSGLTGKLNYSITANGEEVATGEINAGENVTKSITVKEGNVTIVATTSNEQGASPKARLVTYAGYDVPDVVSKLKLTIDENNKATVTWEAPTTGLNHGYLGELTYDVYRFAGNDTTQVAKGQKELMFTETLPKTTMKNYAYGVRAINTTQASNLPATNGVVFGNAFDVPYIEDFESLANAKVFTILDSNGDDRTWSYSTVSANGSFRYTYSEENKGDDWLITPPVKLKAGKNYIIGCRARSASKDNKERIEVMYGKAPTAEAMTNKVVPPTEVENTTFETIEKEITVAEDGEYYFGFHAISDANKFFLYIDDISIVKSPEAQAPDAVIDPVATPDPTGALKANITFKTPDKAINGETLKSLSKIEITSGTRLVKTIDNPTVGTEMTVIDETAAQGENIYTIIAYNEFNGGRKSIVKTFVGIDTPTAPAATVIDLISSVKLDWNDVNGVNNGVVLQKEITYSIYDITDDGALGSLIGETTNGVTEYTIDPFDTNSGSQKYKGWALTAKNSAGESSYGLTSLIVGAPYTLPYHNSFKNMSLENKFIGLKSTSNLTAWGITGKFSVDNDGGALIFHPKTPGYSTLVLGKISMKGAAKPKIMFNYLNSSEVPVTLSVNIQHQNGTIDDALWTKEIAPVNNGETTWNGVSIDVPAELANEEYAVINITAQVAEALETPFLIDNLNIADPLRNDASIILTNAPEKVKKGQDVNVTLRVTNQGLETMKNAKVTLKSNGKLVFEKTVEQELSLLQNVEIPVVIRTSTIDKSEKLNLEAEVSMANDLDEDNNKATASVALEIVEQPAPVNPTAQQGANNSVDLAWNSPSLATEIVEDNFEGYDAWSLEFGNWTTVDADNGHAGSLSKNSNYLHQGEKFAFINWQPSDMFKEGQGLDPHSGTKSAVAIYQVNEGGTNYVDCNNWLISPQLSGKAQTVSIWVNNYKGDGFGTENFEFMVSSTNKETDSFQKVGDTYTMETGKWTEISVDVPEGTKYFAIHHITAADQSFLFMIDDARFETSNAPVSYNVYRDGVFIGNTTNMNFNDATPGSDGEHTYSITAVYNDGSESEPVNVMIVTDINSISLNGEGIYDVYTIDGKQVMKGAKTLKGLDKGVYLINGKKFVIN